MRHSPPALHGLGGVVHKLLRSTNTTRCSSAASASATPWPMPCAAPVTMQILLLKRGFIRAPISARWRKIFQNRAFGAMPDRSSQPRTASTIATGPNNKHPHRHRCNQLGLDMLGNIAFFRGVRRLAHHAGGVVKPRVVRLHFIELFQRHQIEIVGDANTRFTGCRQPDTARLSSMERKSAMPVPPARNRAGRITGRR